MSFIASPINSKDGVVVGRANSDMYHNIIVNARSKMYTSSAPYSLIPGLYNDRKVMNVLFTYSAASTISLALISNVNGGWGSNSNLFGSQNVAAYTTAVYNDVDLIWYIQYRTLSEAAAASSLNDFDLYDDPVYTNNPIYTRKTKAELLSGYSNYVQVTGMTAYRNPKDGQYSGSNKRMIQPIPVNNILMPSLLLNFDGVQDSTSFTSLSGEMYVPVWALIAKQSSATNTNVKGMFNKAVKIDVDPHNGLGSDPLFNGCFWNLAALKLFLNTLNIKFTFTLEEATDINTEDFTSGYVPSGQGNASTGGGNGTGNNSTDPIELETPGISTYSTFNQLYAMSNAQLNSLATYLWTETWLDDFKLLFNQPMEGIISCKLFPFSISGHDSGHIGSSTAIKIGNVTTTAMGQPIQSGYNSKFDLGSITIDEYFGSFMDYDPYTDIYLYLPYIGIRQLPTNEVMKKTLTITYIVDLMTGACTAVIKTGDIIICSFDGMIGVDIPVTGSNAARFGAGVAGSVATGAAGAGALIAGAATGGAALAVAGAGLAISTAKNVISNKRTIEKGNSIDAQNGFHMPNYCYLIITRPEQQLPQNYGSNFGFPSNIGQTLNQLIGYTECYDVKANSITGATSEEVAEIKQLLENGVIIR